MNLQHPDSRSTRDWAYVKDRIIESYIPVYISAMVKRKKVPLMIDAFAGPGKYQDGSEGSPLIMINTAFETLKRQNRKFFFRKVAFLFSEINDKWFNNLKKSVLKKWEKTGAVVGAKPPIVVQTSGKQLVEKVIEFLKQEEKFAPFLYLDPWGIKGIERDILIDFLSLREEGLEAEILFRFPPKEVFRFYRNPKLSKRWLEEKIGTFKLDDIENSVESREYILERYIKAFSSFYNKEDLYYVAVEVPARPPYYMVFFTEHTRGCFEMGIAMTNAIKKYLSKKGIILGVALSQFSVSDADYKAIIDTLQELSTQEDTNITVEELVANIYRKSIFPKFFRRPKYVPGITTWQDALKDLRNQGKVIFLDGKVSEPHCRICLAG